MKHDDDIPNEVIVRNTAGILIAGIVTALISAAVGILISLWHNPPLHLEGMLGWGVLGIILFGFPIIMGLLALRRPA